MGTISVAAKDKGLTITLNPDEVDAVVLTVLRSTIDLLKTMDKRFKESDHPDIIAACERLIAWYGPPQ